MRVKHAVQNGPELKRELARMRSLHHARDGARILSDSIPYWPLETRPIIAELVRQLEECNLRLQELAREEEA
jgi:hypothetical protein